MRLIGNKTRLIPRIEEFMQERGISEGVMLDAFAGSTVVGQHFRSKGFIVHSNDLLQSSYVASRVHICLEEVPKHTGDLLAALGDAPPRYGLISRQFSEGSGRLYFSEENGHRIDGMHHQLMSWLHADKLSADQFYILLLALLEASDKVANISGTYGAFLKTLQKNAAQQIKLEPLSLDLRGPKGCAWREDATTLAQRVNADVLYIDPPYTSRQYPKYYHVREIIAELHTVKDLEVYERSIYGKTGLLGFEDRLSAYCRKKDVYEAFLWMVTQANADHIVVSYSEEGILTAEEIGAALAESSGQGSFDYERDFVRLRQKRFRSDSDLNREYKVLEGRDKDEVQEWLFYVRRP